MLNLGRGCSPWERKIPKCGPWEHKVGRVYPPTPTPFLVQRRGAGRGGRFHARLGGGILGMGHVASLSRLCIPASSPSSRQRWRGSPMEASGFAFTAPLYRSPFGEEGARPGHTACWKSLKYMRVSANTLLNHGVSPPLVYLNSRADLLPLSRLSVSPTGR